jgi:hemolysin III
MPIRQPGNFYTHAIPTVCTIPAGAYLIYISNSPVKVFSSVIYALCFFLLFLTSSLYHSIPKNEIEVQKWRSYDHASIYLMIAGTYTPTVLILFSGWLMWALIITVWAIAIFGSVSKLLGKLKNHRVSLTLYLAMGWLIIVVLKQMIEFLPAWALFWLFAGGFFYSVGAIFYNLDKDIQREESSGKKLKYSWPPVIKKYPHEIWHLFVFAGAACHYYYTLKYLIA